MLVHMPIKPTKKGITAEMKGTESNDEAEEEGDDEAVIIALSYLY